MASKAGELFDDHPEFGTRVRSPREVARPGQSPYLSDFRVAYGQALDDMLTDSVASLMAAGVVQLKRVAQDDMGMRASAGAGSFRRNEKLERYLEDAKQQVAARKQQIEDEPGALRWRSQAAKERAVRDTVSAGDGNAIESVEWKGRDTGGHTTRFRCVVGGAIGL